MWGNPESQKKKKVLRVWSVSEKEMGMLSPDCRTEFRGHQVLGFREFIKNGQHFWEWETTSGEHRSIRPSRCMLSIIHLYSICLYVSGTFSVSYTRLEWRRTSTQSLKTAFFHREILLFSLQFLLFCYAWCPIFLGSSFWYRWPKLALNCWSSYLSTPSRKPCLWSGTTLLSSWLFWFKVIQFFRVTAIKWE